jgi:hypothetical protein
VPSELDCDLNAPLLLLIGFVELLSRDSRSAAEVPVSGQGPNAAGKQVVTLEAVAWERDAVAINVTVKTNHVVVAVFIDGWQSTSVARPFLHTSLRSASELTEVVHRICVMEVHFNTSGLRRILRVSFALEYDTLFVTAYLEGNDN